jgi:hypothetical protein
MLNRFLWGTPTQQPSLEEQSAELQKLIDAETVQLERLTADLNVIGGQIKQSKSAAVKQSLKQKGTRVLTDRQACETRINGLLAQQSNLNTLNAAVVSSKTAATTCSTLASAVATMKSQKMSAPDTEDTLYELQEFVDESKHLNDTISRAFTHGTAAATVADLDAYFDEVEIDAMPAVPSAKLSSSSSYVATGTPVKH